MLDRVGNYIRYSEITKRCADANFMIRAGCSCNPGACHNFLGINEEMVIRSAVTRQSCGDDQDNLQGQPLGAVRVSFGYPTTIHEIDAFIKFLAEHFVNYKQDMGKIFGFM